MKIAWISYFPVEWLPDLPPELQQLPRLHPAPWQRVLLNELRSRPGLKFHIVVVRKYFEQTHTFDWHGVTFHCLKAPGGWRRPSLFWVDTFLIRRALRLVQPDLVHAWGTEDSAPLVASRLGYPFLGTVQGILEWYVKETGRGGMLRLAVLFERWALHRCRIATAESAFSSAYVRRRFPHLEVHHVDLAPDELFHRVARRPRLAPVHLLFVGTVGFAKGADVLLRALAKLESDFHLLFVGGEHADFMQKLRAELPARVWSQVEFKQNLTSDMMADELAQATLMVCPTRVDTGPLAVKEAVVAGVPVIGSQVGGIPDYVVPGKNGFLFPAGDVDALAQALRAAMTHPLFSKGLVDPATLQQVRTYLSPRVMGDKFLAVYQRVCERSTKRASHDV